MKKINVLKTNINKVVKKQNGITLIALVITIIVLLILAAVSIAMLTGENGILSKASNAKEKHLIAQYEEELNLCIMEMQTDELGTLTMQKLIEKLPQYIQASQPGEQCEWDTKQETEEPTGTYKGYEFYVDKNKKAHITGKATGIMISCSVDPSGYTNKNVKATITITCTEGIQSIKQTKPTKETITASGTEKTIVKENIGENTTFEYEVIDSKENKDTKIAQVTNIDKTDPSECKIEAKVNDDGAIEVKATAEDAKSGIERYECYVNEEEKGESNDGTFKIENLASGTYSVYVIAYDKAGNSKKSDLVSDLEVSVVMKDITAQMVADHPEKYYGLKVTNYESKNGQDDWKIFYSDGEHIFLITGGYVDLSIANEGTTKLNSNTGMTKIGTKHRVYWTRVKLPADLQISKDENGKDIDSTVKTRFMATNYTLNNNNNNSKSVSTLLNVDNWKDYKDNGNMAEYAIGGSAIEMWVASWNELCERKYNKPNDKLYCNKTNSNGCGIGTSSDSGGDQIDNLIMQKKDGFNNSLYYPYHKSIPDGELNCSSYWIASPATTYSGDYLLEVSSDGRIYRDYYYGTNTALRPVVSLNSKITVDATE